MHRSALPPPRPVAGAPASSARVVRAGREPSVPVAPGPALEYRRLDGPAPASTRLRRFFEPATGWFRLLERRASFLLARYFFPRLPGIGYPYSRQLERHLTLSEADVPVSGLPAGFVGATVLLVTDIHAGPFLTAGALDRAFERLLGEEPDLILLGGDVATSRMDDIEPFLPAFRRLEAPLGVFAVMGNHDHYVQDPARLRRELEATGVRYLHNDAAVLERGGDRLVLAGIDDLLVGRPDLDSALASAAGPGDGAPVVLLSHNPDVLFDAAGRGIPLVLSGHTHGGQVRLPRLPVLVRMSRYRLDEGRYTSGGTEVVVSRGMGVAGLPLRFGCPPEAVLVRLTRGPSSAGGPTSLQ